MLEAIPDKMNQITENQISAKNAMILVEVKRQKNHTWAFLCLTQADIECDIQQKVSAQMQLRKGNSCNPCLPLLIGVELHVQIIDDQGWNRNWKLKWDRTQRAHPEPATQA